MNLDDFEIDAEVKAKILALHEADVQGLKAKNSELIERETKAKQATEDLRTEYVQAEQDAKVALAEKEGDIAKYKDAVAERDTALNTLKHDFAQEKNQRLLDEAVNEFSANLSDDPAARSYMQNLFKESIDVQDGQLKPKDVTKDLTGLQQAILSDEANAKYVKANVGSGTGSAGSNGSGSATVEKSAVDILYNN